MKTILLIFLLPVSGIFAGQESNNTQTPNQYLEKSIRQKKTANVISITGGTLLVTGLIIAFSDDQKGWLPSSTTLTGIGIATLGTATALASVPFYISPHSNKRKSVTLSPQMGNAVIGQKYYPTAGIGISF